MSEPTAALSYSDLILFVAEQLGVAYYGSAGNQVAQIPVDAFELDKCTRYVNDGFRMFMADAPLNGWRWQRPLLEIDLWPEKGIAMPPATAGPNLALAFFNGVSTTVTTTTAWFDASMVGKILAVQNTGLFTITAFLTATSVEVAGNVAWIGGHTFLVADPTGSPTMTGVWNGTTLTTVTAAPGTFYPSTEGKTLFITGEATSRTLTNYISDTTMTIPDLTGAQAWAGAKTFNLSSQGIYTLPQDFGGEVLGEITYQAGSNRGVPINWIHELEIRRLRENWNSVSGNPYYAAVRRVTSQNRRWELLVYPNTGGTYRVEFPGVLYFDKIDPANLTAVHPAGFQHDEAVKAACLAQAEMQGEDVIAGRMDYYRQTALPNSKQIDARSAPRRLGYCGNPRATSVALRDFRQYFRRPTVTFRQ